MEIISMKSFAAPGRSGKDENNRDACFVRMLGRNADFDQELFFMDDTLSAQMGQGRLFYKRISKLPPLSDSEDILYYTQCYDRWKAAPRKGMATKVSKDALALRLGAACEEAAEKYLHGKAAATESMRKNFVVKLLYWFDFVCAGFYWDSGGCIKIAADNVTKEQEYLFYYILSHIGCEVLLLQSRGDLAKKELKNLSKEVCIGAYAAADVPAYVRPGTEEKKDKIIVKIPERNRKKTAVQKNSGQTPKMRRQEKSYEQLAALASSIVLILVHNQEGEVTATGSGIMIGKDGYILTNDHVVRGGYSYSIRVENDETVYQTDELIKYHTTLDLALLRIPKRLQPIPIYEGPEKLVRGQAVAAIGSPLGLFNSISDGIISGFRTIDGVDMIQFTAPISHGSSGGAVLNMYGEVIGIATAGFDRGQNINLAVGYESILLFIKGFR